MAQDADAVREAIARDRAELADTVQALARKVDVKERVREKVSKGTEQVQQKAGEVREQLRQVTPEPARSQLSVLADMVKERPVPFLVAGALVVGLVLGRLWARER
jgi:predicted Holliday junction resolvase-like endonuclease